MKLFVKSESGYDSVTMSDLPEAVKSKLEYVVEGITAGGYPVLAFVLPSKEVSGPENVSLLFWDPTSLFTLSDLAAKFMGCASVTPATIQMRDAIGCGPGGITVAEGTINFD